MNVVVAKSAGFCWGVRRAVELPGDGGATPYTDGPLIHNEHMMRRFAKPASRNPSAASCAAGLIDRTRHPPERRAA